MTAVAAADVAAVWLYDTDGSRFFNQFLGFGAPKLHEVPLTHLEPADGPGPPEAAKAGMARRVASIFDLEHSMAIVRLPIFSWARVFVI